jgi:hypothetical protein
MGFFECPDPVRVEGSADGVDFAEDGIGDEEEPVPWGGEGAGAVVGEGHAGEAGAAEVEAFGGGRVDGGVGVEPGVDEARVGGVFFEGDDAVAEVIGFVEEDAAGA